MSIRRDILAGLSLVSPGLWATPVTAVDSNLLYWKTFGSLILVLLVIVALAWLVRRMNPTWLGGQSGLKVIAGLALGHKEKLVVVQCGEQQLLLAVTPGQVRCLHVLTEALPEQNQAAVTPFSQLLANYRGGRS